MQQIEWKGSLFQSPRNPNYKPVAVVMHVMAGTLAGTDAWFNDPRAKVSAHYGIGKKGEIHQYVSENMKAWHAGVVSNPKVPLLKNAAGVWVNPNEWTIGIEHEGTGTAESPLALYISSARLLADICKRWSIPLDRQHVLLHRELYGVKPCPGVLDVDLILRLANLATLE